MIRVSKQVYGFLEDCKHKCRAKSFEELFRKISASLWELCEEVEYEHNKKIMDSGFDGDLYIFTPPINYDPKRNDEK